MRLYVPYNVARQHIQDGDMLAYRPKWWHLVGQLIATVGRSPVSHTAMAHKENGSLEAIAMRIAGGSRDRLSVEVRKYPGRIDVYRPSKTITRHFVNSDGVQEQELDCDYEKMVYLARTMVGRRYGWLSIACIAFRFLPVVRLFVRSPRDDVSIAGRDPFCSGMYSWTCKKAYTDPVPGFANRDTTPGELTRNPLFSYLFTLDRENSLVENLAQAIDSN